MTEKKVHLKLSVSKAKTFADCKKKFKFNYIEKLPQKEWEFHTFGKFCHKVLEDFHLAYIAGSLKPFNVEIKTAWDAAMKEFGSSMSKDMVTECYEIIHNYLKLVSKQKDDVKNVIACEKGFNLNIDDRVLLNGFIDRLQVDEDGILHVCDYKTSKSDSYLKNDYFQLLTYAYVLCAEDPTIKKVRGSYIMLRHNFQYITKEFDIEEIIAIKDKYLSYADQIQSEEQYPANPTRLCSYCSYLDMCPEGKSKSFGTPFFGEVAW